MPSLRQSFDAVVDLPPEARRDWMDRHCSDPTDRHHLEALLAAHAQRGGGGGGSSPSPLSAAPDWYMAPT